MPTEKSALYDRTGKNRRAPSRLDAYDSPMAPTTGDSLLNVIDVEATCWEGPVPHGQANEIIEIGLCVVDLDTRRRVARDRILVRPESSEVSAFCTELTGLTQEEVDAGRSFQEACAVLTEQHGAASRRWAGWGEYDRRQFERQCATLGVDYPFALRHSNAKRRFAEAHGLRRQIGMSRALAKVGLRLEGRHHSGADDAWNIAALILHLLERDAWPVDPILRDPGRSRLDSAR
jgi:inhibitor of KinA sporulation pathway (predicted exonuclease)